MPTIRYNKAILSSAEFEAIKLAKQGFYQGDFKKILKAPAEDILKILLANSIEVDFKNEVSYLNQKR